MEQWYSTIRATAAFLKVHGYADADTLPLGRMFVEAAHVKKILESQTRTEAILIQSAASSIMSKEGGKYFHKLIKRLANGG